MISPCHSVKKENIHRRLDFVTHPPSLFVTPTSSSKSLSKVLISSKHSGTSDNQQGTEEIVFQGAGRIDMSSEVLDVSRRDFEPEAVTVSCDSSAGDYVESQGLLSKDETQTCNLVHHDKQGKNDMSFDCISYVDCSPLSERACVMSTSGIDTEVSSEPVKRTPHQLCLASDIIDLPCVSDVSPSLSPSYTVYVTVEDVEEIEHTIPEVATHSVQGEVDAGRIQLLNVQDLQHLQQEGQKHLLTEDNVCSEMSDEDCIVTAEQNELISKSATSVIADVHVPASPPLFSADEADEACCGVPQEEEELYEENDEVCSFHYAPCLKKTDPYDFFGITLLKQAIDA